MCSDDTVAIWRAELERVQKEPEWIEGDPNWITYRTPEVIGALQDFLQAYLAGEVSLRTLQITFDKNTRTIWNAFGLKGMSGAMFLNTLVKYMPDQQAVDEVLKHALPVPADEPEAREKMSRLVSLVDAATASGEVKKTHVQASRAAFFLSAWWHIQKREAWPVYYVSMRRMFERFGVWEPHQENIIDDYIRFREAALALSHALAVDSWTLERLCLWLDAASDSELDPPAALKPSPAVTASLIHTDDSEPDSSTDGSLHTQVQLLLARLGQKFKCRVWIAQNDHGRQWQGEKLGSYSIPSLPTLGIGDPAQNIVKMIDVIWLKGVNQVVAAFEIERTTTIYSGLLRMSDLAVLAPNTHFPIYIVSPEAKLPKVREQLRRPTFQHIELHERTRFFSIEKLIDTADDMLMWSTDAAVINKIAERVDSEDNLSD